MFSLSNLLIWWLVTDYFSAISSDEDEEFFELPPENCQISSNHSDIDGTLLSQHGNHSKSKSSGKKLFSIKHNLQIIINWK